MGALAAWFLILMGYGSFVISVFFKKEVPDEDSEGAFNLITVFVGLFLTLPLMMFFKKSLLSD